MSQKRRNQIQRHIERLQAQDKELQEKGDLIKHEHIKMMINVLKQEKRNEKDKKGEIND